MDFSQVVRARRTHRDFFDTPIASDQLARIVQAGTRAPSAGFTQATRILVLDRTESVRTFWDSISTPQWRAANPARSGLDHAPCIIVVLEDRSAYLERYHQPDKAYSKIDTFSDFPAPFWTIDAAFTAMMIQLAIVNEGLGYLFFGIPQGIEELRAKFSIPTQLNPIGAIALGHPASSQPSHSSQVRRRLRTEDVIKYNLF